jgi:hypothetical protein
MAEVDNPSFETSTVIGFELPGFPDQWLLSRGGTSWEYGVFVSQTLFAEDFETGWLANEGRRTVFGGGELDNAAFDTVPEAFEDFEEEWNSNEDRKTEFSVGQLDDASFDSGTPENVEDFEEEWNSNEDRRTVFGGGELDDASFDSGTPEAFEDFEEEWNGNEGRRTVFGGGELDNAAFQILTGTINVETFDDWITLVVLAGVAIGPAITLDPTQPNRIVFGGTLTGTVELQVRRDGFATWETYETITSVPATVNLSAGFSEVRVERTGAGGTTTAGIYWSLLTEL